MTNAQLIKRVHAALRSAGFDKGARSAMRYHSRVDERGIVINPFYKSHLSIDKRAARTRYAIGAIKAFGLKCIDDFAGYVLVKWQ